MTWTARVGALLLLVLAGACLNGDSEPSTAVTVGVGSTTEQRMLAALSLVALSEAGIDAEVRADLGGTVALRREAIRGNVDLFWDYTGAAWALGLGNPAPPADPIESYERVRNEDEANELTWLAPADVNATLALFVQADEVAEAGESQGLSWLAGVLSAGDETLCADPDFVERTGGLDALAEAYAIDLGRLEVVGVDEETAVEQVEAGACRAGLATATSGKAAQAGLVPVADDLAVFPAFVVAPVARDAAVDAMPGLEEALRVVTERLDTSTLARLNAAVEDGADPEEVAEGFLLDG